MKSLEIVDKLLEKINQYDDWFLTEMEAEQIKQDLEVLEILMKKFEFEPIDSDTNIISEYEMNKVKQWLEENE